MHEKITPAPSSAPPPTVLYAALAQMLPAVIGYDTQLFYWAEGPLGVRFTGRPILDSELLHLCSLVEATLDRNERMRYSDLLSVNAVTAYDSLIMCASASWQRRVKALIRIKSIGRCDTTGSTRPRECDTTTDGKPPRPGYENAPAPAPVNPATGQHEAYWVLSENERAKGFKRPLRTSYIHDKGCGWVTSMGQAIAETYARDPSYYGSTMCVKCGSHFPVDQFKWNGTEERVGS